MLLTGRERKHVIPTFFLSLSTPDREEMLGISGQSQGAMSEMQTTKTKSSNVQLVIIVVLCGLHRRRQWANTENRARVKF